MPDENDTAFEADAELYRTRMVEQQLLSRDIRDTDVLAAMRTVPRHQFVPGVGLAEAYGDHPVPIGQGQTISQPYMVASMTQELQLDHDSIVLEIGTGCGYQTAVLAEIVRHVYSIEYIRSLLADADKTLKRLMYGNVTTRVGDGYLGWPEYAPFHGIVVTAAAPRIPEPLLDQLAEGGRMVIPVSHGSDFSQELVRMTRTPEGITRESLYGVRFVSMRGRISET
jgi:protein-L-isoaspartate(D-aspartate) O-methyltransferase